MAILHLCPAVDGNPLQYYRIVNKNVIADLQIEQCNSLQANM